MKICPICKRLIPEYLESDHHLIPYFTKLKKKAKYKDIIENIKITLHTVCHGKIHSLFTNKELSNYFNTVERLLSNQDIQSFVKWIRTKPIDFVDTSKQSNIRKLKSYYG